MQIFCSNLKVYSLSNDTRKFSCSLLLETNEISQLAKILPELAFPFLYSTMAVAAFKTWSRHWWSTLIRIVLMYLPNLSEDPSSSLHKDIRIMYQGAFNNYVDQILPIFAPLPPWSGQAWTFYIPPPSYLSSLTKGGIATSERISTHCEPPTKSRFLSVLCHQIIPRFLIPLWVYLLKF